MFKWSFYLYSVNPGKHLNIFSIVYTPIEKLSRIYFEYLENILLIHCSIISNILFKDNGIFFCQRTYKSFK